MNLRVNLLKEAEQRYQGPVSIRFLLRTGGIGLGVLLLIFVALSMHGQFMLKRNLKAAKEEWVRLGPRYDEITKRQALLANYKGLLDELNAWGPTNAHMHEMLLELQKTVPESVQLLQLNIGADWVFIKPEQPKAKPPPPKGEHPDPKAKKEKPPPKVALAAQPGRQAQLRITGRVEGELADEIVVQFMKALHKAPGFSTTIDSMELQRLYKDDSNRGGGGNWRQFEIQGTAKPRMMP